MKFASFVHMRLADYINDLLYRYDCVIVPNFGGFVTNKIGAKVDESANAIYPPKKQVTFNAYLQHNDGLLANYIASTEKVSFEKATEKIAQEVDTWKNQLETGTITVAKVGTLTRNEERKLVFEPNTSTNFLIDSFGLAQAGATSVEREEAQVAEVVVLDEKKEGKVIPLVLKRAAAAAVVVGIIYAGWNGVQNHNEQQEFLANQQKEIQSATFVIDSPLPTIDLKVSKEEPKNFHIVAGAFQEVENAYNKVNELVEKGFESKIIGENSFGLTQVVFGSYHTKESARTALIKIKEDVSEDAWLLEK
ncbi:Sporulation related domain-containing protein [Tenacibaculum sp. MAR_2009_124]|nr:Sporulation related domain-containing protein [Tenacibaculum sp. MAR_2009_124]